MKSSAFNEEWAYAYDAGNNNDDDYDKNNNKNMLTIICVTQLSNLGSRYPPIFVSIPTISTSCYVLNPKTWH